MQETEGQLSAGARAFDGAAASAENPGAEGEQEASGGVGPGGPGARFPRSQDERGQGVLRLSFSYQCEVMGCKASTILHERPCVFSCAMAFHHGYIWSMNLEFLKQNSELWKNVVRKEPELYTSSPRSLREALAGPQARAPAEDETQLGVGATPRSLGEPGSSSDPDNEIPVLNTHLLGSVVRKEERMRPRLFQSC